MAVDCHVDSVLSIETQKCSTFPRRCLVRRALVLALDRPVRKPHCVRFAQVEKKRRPGDATLLGMEEIAAETHVAHDGTVLGCYRTGTGPHLTLVHGGMASGKACFALAELLAN